MDIKTILKKVAAKERINEKDIEIAYTHFIQEMKKALTSEDMPKVLIHNFGTFSVSLIRLENQIRYHIGRYYKGHVNKYDLKKILEPMFKVRKRLKIEQQYKNEKKINK